MPKIYFYDTGLACNLLGITNTTQLETHYLKGSIFENFVISEYFKNKFHYGQLDNFFFWRDNTGHEIDLVIENLENLIPVEIKSGKTVHDEFFKNLRYWLKLTGEKEGKIIYAGDLDQKRSEGINVISWKNLSSFM